MDIVTLGMAAKEARLYYSYSRVHLPFRIRILQEHKKGLKPYIKVSVLLCEMTQKLIQFTAIVLQ